LLFPNVFAGLYAPGGILEILWSIGIEEQFYLVIAPLMLFIRNNKLIIILTILALAYFVIFHIDYFGLLPRFQFLYFFILFGGVIAVLEEQEQLNFLKHNAIGLLIVLLTVIHFLTDWLKVDSRLIYNLITTILFSLFIHAISCNPKLYQIKNKTLNYLGSISYGIYMYHAIVLNAVVFLFLQLKKSIAINNVVTVILINVLTITLSIIVAHFSYKYFETYFLKLKNKFR